jgi:hypothetical protein
MLMMVNMESTPAVAHPTRNVARLYKAVSIILFVVFAVVGVVFLSMPDGVLVLFNDFSTPLGLPNAPLGGAGFYLVLAVAYMYFVSLLAMLMFRHPENRGYPFLLVNAKSASSVLSLLLFLFFHPYLVFLANCVVDGAIAVFVAILNIRMKRALV